MTNFKIYYSFEFISYKAIENINTKKMKRESTIPRGPFNINLPLINKNGILNMIKDDLSIMIDERINNYHNNQDSITFGENITKALQMELNWSQSENPIDFYYREFKFKNAQNTQILWKYNYAKISINTFEFYIKFNENNKTFEIFLQFSDILPYYRIENSSKEFEKEIFGKNIVFFPSKRMKINSLFEVSNFHFPCFKDDEASIIYKNFEEKDIENLAYIIMEIESGFMGINGLIEKIRKDNNLMSKILKHQILFLGFYKKTDIDADIDISDMIPVGVKFALVEMKNGYLFGRNMMQKIDWALVKEFRTYAKSNDKKLEDIKNEIGTLKNGMEGLSQNMNQILNLFAQQEKEEKSDTSLGKKIKRNNN